MVVNQRAKRINLKPTAQTSTPVSYSYLILLWLFRFLLKVFYSNVIVEGADNIVKDGVPCVLCSNHTNSLTDAILLMTTTPKSHRRMLRLTAKATQFGRGTFVSWLVQALGTLPIFRPKDYNGTPVDNSIVFAQLIEALQIGDCVCIFPEGLSRYYPELAKMRQGPSRIISDVLSLQKDNPSFTLAIQTCSITYLHRNLFRSDVLVVYHPPILVSPSTHPLLLSTPTQPVSETAVRELTAQIETDIRSGTLYAPSWLFIRLGNSARRLYAPLGTALSLGEHVRLTKQFVELFVGREGEEKSEVVATLGRDLKIYQDLLYLHGIKDDRVRNVRMLRRTTLYKRLLVRSVAAIGFMLLSAPGILLLWSPIFVVTRYMSEKAKKTGPVFDTYDEIAQIKLITGLFSFLVVYALYLILFLPFFPLTLFLIPLAFWLSLRWLEDLTSTLRAGLALFRLLHLGKGQLLLLREMREELRARVVELAVNELGLPREAEEMVRRSEPRWKRALHAGFFSLRRRRKKDWNEVLKLYDQTEFPEDDLPTELQ